MDPQKQLQDLSDQYQDIQSELSNLVTARQKLESQQQENKGVQAEFANLKDDAKIYKLVGPVLLRQESSEARSTVDGRLEFIANEIKRIEGSIKGVQDKSDAKRTEIMQVQSQMQQVSSQG